MAILSVAITSAMISGSYFASVLLKYLTLTETLCVVIGVLALGFFYCLIRIDEKPPEKSVQQEEYSVQAEREPKETDGLLHCGHHSSCKGCCAELAPTLR